MYDLELKFQEFPNVRVKLIPFNHRGGNDLKKYTIESKVFFRDEFTDSFFKDAAKNETISLLKSLDFCWLTVSNCMWFKGNDEKRNFRDYIEDWKPDGYKIIELKTPIRSTREIAKHLKENLTDNK